VANVTKASLRNDKEIASEHEHPEAAPDGPLLDLGEAAVTKMIKRAKKRGYITPHQINEVLPPEEVTSDRIEIILAMLNEMGINVVEQEEAGPEEGETEAEEAEEERENEGELVEVLRKVPAEPKKSEPGERVDDPDVRAFIVEALKESGYKVREATDGRSGIAEIGRDPVDLVIIDFVMPEMSGADVAREIRVKYPGQPVLFVSGYSETDAVKRTAPDAPLLAKPFRADALEKAVRGALTPQG